MVGKLKKLGGEVGDHVVQDGWFLFLAILQLRDPFWDGDSEVNRDLQVQDKKVTFNHLVDVGSFMFVVKFCSCSKVSFFFGGRRYM